MTAPSTYLREKREARARRRLEVAKILAADPETTNLELAKALHVSRNTIQEDREALVSDMQSKALATTEEFWVASYTRLEQLLAELELHRDGDGKLPARIIREAHLIMRTLIEYRVPKPESRVSITHRKPVQFNVTIGPKDKATEVFTVTQEATPLLEAGNENQN